MSLLKQLSLWCLLSSDSIISAFINWKPSVRKSSLHLCIYSFIYICMDSGTFRLFSKSSSILIIVDFLAQIVVDLATDSLFMLASVLFQHGPVML